MKTPSSSDVQTVRALLPGASVGVIGGGQLGRYLVLEARRLGYVTWVLDPDAQAPAMQLAEHALVAAYDDAEALAALAEACDAVTIEFENVPARSLALLADRTRVAPSAEVVRVAQDRDLEKRSAEAQGLRPVPYATVECADDVAAAVAAVGLPAILKTSRLGYDGKGQIVCDSENAVFEALLVLQDAACVLERHITLAAEISVVLARGFSGEIAVFPISRNVHVNGILSTSTVPADVSAGILASAESQAIRLAEGLDYHGVLAVEFFIDERGQVYFNEMAPRPHNSGHYTLDATVCSQFEMQLRALCALPLGSTTLLSPVCMINLLGDVWSSGTPDWHRVFEQAGAHLHLYGKHVARPGRKMGHINCLADSADSATAMAVQCLSLLER
ncbi:MAG: 5-(carboxyamino)imidazole ribonucleotide synthase [Granulosicoccus sp.]|nr:5-(carboxyamino)imidazole ribonucleotide synthase [Granulosicoccus sp.]